MERRMKWEASLDKSRAIKSAETEGRVADSMEVRTALIEKLHRGEATLAEIQAELAKIKRGAKKAGMTTRERVWRES